MILTTSRDPETSQNVAINAQFAEFVDEKRDPSTIGILVYDPDHGGFLPTPKKLAITVAGVFVPMCAFQTSPVF